MDVRTKSEGFILPNGVQKRIDKLISSYRAQIYDWSVKQWLAFLKEKWKPVLISLIFLLLPIGIYVFGVAKKSAIIMLLSLLAEGVSLWLLDRHTVKHHIAFLQNRQSHLKETEVFLRKTIPDVNLFQEELIDELIKRLSDRIDQRVPFKNFLKEIESFAKAIILPITTYVAGVYSAGLEEISIDVVATYAVFIIMLLGIVRLSWVGFSDIAKTFFCRDYNAAIAFREDLLDLRLLYFRIDKDANKND